MLQGNQKIFYFFRIAYILGFLGLCGNILMVNKRIFYEIHDCALLLCQEYVKYNPQQI